MVCKNSSLNCDCSCPDFSELAPVLEKYAKVPGSLITVLQKTQDIYGYLSIDAIKYIAQKTGIKPAKIYGVATFYTQFRLAPIGKYLIMLCKGTACHVNGADAEAITEGVSMEMETTEDGIFTLCCLFRCCLAPVMMVMVMRRRNLRNLTKDTVKTLREIRKEYRR